MHQENKIKWQKIIWNLYKLLSKSIQMALGHLIHRELFKTLYVVARGEFIYPNTTSKLSNTRKILKLEKLKSARERYLL